MWKLIRFNMASKPAPEGTNVFVVRTTKWTGEVKTHRGTEAVNHDGETLSTGFDEAFPNDLLTIFDFKDRLLFGAWIQRGCLEKVGITTYRGWFEPTPAFLKELRARWEIEHPNTAAPERGRTDSGAFDRGDRRITGGLSLRCPMVYEVVKLFGPFIAGDLVSPNALFRKTWQETAERVRELARDGYVKVVARIENDAGLTCADNDDFAWATERQDGVQVCLVGAAGPSGGETGPPAAGKITMTGIEYWQEGTK